MKLTENLKTLALSALTLLILMLMILWMAGVFQRKIEPETLAGSLIYQGPSLTVEQTDEPVFEYATGTLESKQTGDISAEVQARIKAILVKAGDTVKPGEVLITLDDATMAARTTQAQQAINALAARLAGAEAHYLRTRNLFEKDSATRVDLDAAQSEYHAVRAQKAAAEAQLRETAHIRDFSTIKARFAARVIDRHAEPGEIAYPGKKLLTLYDPAALRVEAHIRESVAVELAPGQVLQAHVEALNLDLPATIEDIVPAANPGARNVLIKMRIENRPGLYPGLFVRIRIPRGQEQVLAIPQAYVHQVGQLDVVWVLNQDRIERRFIRLGHELPGGRVSVVSGLGNGEKLLPPERGLSD